MFYKPRALSRQQDANIRIEVHRDETIVNHLQTEQKANMNLMFYDFNGSSCNQKNSTGTNFYQGNNNSRPDYTNNQTVATNGDRLPTRERGYRSANQYVRRRPGLPMGINNGVGNEEVEEPHAVGPQQLQYL